MAQRALYQRMVRARIAARNRRMNNPEVWMARAQYYTRLKRHSTARKWLNRIVHHFPKSRQAVDAKEMLAYGSGRSRKQ